MTRFGVAAAGAAAVTLALAGCGGSSQFDSSKVEYKTEKKLPPLEVPPDLTQPGREDRFQIPEPAATSATTLSAYNAERSGPARPGTIGVLPDFAKLRVERAGNERWLVVPEPPEKVWPLVKDFWLENGFLIMVESPETGVMETDWAENRSKIKQDPFRNFFGGFSSTGERDKFRTRLERGLQPGTTEIYVSHRGVVEVQRVVNQYVEDTSWRAKPPDPGLEAEFLRRLLVRFGAQDARARVELAADKKDERAKIVNAADGIGTLELAEPFDRAWRRVGLVLDRVGFTVEDRDRSKGFYFVRYVDPEADALLKKNEGILDKLMFWRSAPDPKAEQYRVFVKDGSGDASSVQVLNKEGNPDRSDTARRILALLQSQLK